MSALTIPSPATLSIATESSYLQLEKERQILEQHERSNPPIVIFLLIFLILVGTIVSVYAEQRRRQHSKRDEQQRW